MSLEIRDTPFTKHLYGIYKPVQEGQKLVDAMVAAMDETWRKVRANQIANQGINHILYNGNKRVFAGIEVNGDLPSTAGLQPVDIHFARYIYYRFTGSFTRLGEVYQEIERDIAARNLTTTSDSMEIYGHASENPEKQVTEILIELTV